MIALIPIFFAGMLNWVYDTMAFKPELLPNKFDPKKTDLNKYHPDLLPFEKAWHNLWGVFEYEYKEGFPFKPTLLVFTSDWFHAIQMLQRVMWVIGFALATIAPHPDWHWFWLLVFYIKVSALVYGAGFHTSRILNGWRLQRTKKQ